MYVCLLLLISVFRARRWCLADRVGLPGGFPPNELRSALLELLSQVFLPVLWELAIGPPSLCLRERFLGPQSCPSLLGGLFGFSFTVLVALPLFALYSPLFLLIVPFLSYKYQKNAWEVPFT